ncbi:phosphoglycerate kinase [Alphaproteobacteria bacterium LSUCC0684]
MSSSSSASLFASLDDIDISGKRIFFRTDLNVPMADGVITDTTRIDRTAPGIAALAARGARVIVAAHFGRPKGRRDMSASLAPIAPALAKAVGRPVDFAEDCIGSAVREKSRQMQDGDILLLENLRFHPGEEQGEESFASALAELADIYVNDAFSASHRDHASIAALAQFLPAYPGPLMAEELAALTAALEAPTRPLAAVVGGAKVSTKLAVLNHLVEKVETLIVGGGMANTFLLAKGIGIGGSLAEADMADEAGRIMARAEETGCQLILPDDVVLAREFRKGAPARTLTLGEGEIADDEMILDTGPLTVARAMAAVDQSHTLVWNGPMGAFELPPFDAATVALARHVARRSSESGLVSVAGGGDTVAALNTAGVEQDFHYVSTAGGAFLEWMEGRVLPGVAALMVRG